MEAVQDILPKVKNSPTYVPPVYPDDKIWPAELAALCRDNPKAIKLQIEGLPAVCWNCGGAGMMFVYVIRSGPYPMPNGAKVKWLAGEGVAAGWYQGETHSAPCPRCQGDAWKEYLRANCGLKDNDLRVSIEAFKAEGIYFVKETAKNTARQLLAMNTNPSGFVTFWGEPGRGKSHLLKGLVNGFRGVGVFSQYTNMSDLLGKIRDLFSDDRGGVAVEALIHHYRNVRVLAIDEIDQVTYTPWVKQTIHRLLDTRYEDPCLLTILALRDVNKLPEDLEYLRSRMFGGECIEVCGDDMRWGKK
jgi:DNA replication protein DnaC